MGRENITELLKKGPSYTYLADNLDVSRPTLYRQIEYYKNGEDSKMNRVVKDYFDKIVMGAISSEEEAVKELDNIKFMKEAKAEAARQTINDMQGELDDMLEDFRVRSSSFSPKQRAEALAAIDQKTEEMFELAKSVGIQLRRYSLNQGPERLKWKEGELRSAILYTYNSARVYLDADYDKCENITVELLVRISGDYFSIARYRPAKDTRFVDIQDIPEGPECKYVIKWMDGDKMKSVGPYKIEDTLF